MSARRESSSFVIFGGLNVEETAETMGISTATVGREIRYADAWLRRELQKR